MLENKFEKQVKDTMSEFHLAPSSSVWESVKQRIHKRRRRLWPVLLLLFIGLSVTGYFIYITINAAKPEIKMAEKGISNQKPNQQKVTDNNLKTDSDIIFIDKNFKKPSHIAYRKNKLAVEPNEMPLIKKNLPAFKVLNNSRSDNARQPIGDSLQNNIAGRKPNAPLKQIISRDSSSVHKTEKIEPLMQQKSIDTTSVAAQNKVLPGNDKKLANSLAKKHTWKFGLTTFYGRSNTVETLLDLNKSQSPSISTNPNYDSLGNIYPSKPFKTSYAYKAGLIVQKQITNNISVSGGLNYTHIVTKAAINKGIAPLIALSIPVRSNTGANTFSVNSYYRPGYTSTYTNNYNLLELPISFQQTFLNHKSLSVSYNAGVTISQSLNSNALIYDHYNNAYYIKDDLFRKTHFQMQAGLNMNLRLNKNSSLFFGPQIQYSLSNLLKNTDYGKQHFLIYGLNAGILIGKK